LNTLGDGEEDMFNRRDAGDELIDAVLNEAALPIGDAALGAVLTELAMVAESAAPRPSRALADVLSGAVALAPDDTAPAPRSRARRMVARLAGVGAATKIWLTAVAAGASLTAAAGVSHDLPGPAQRIFEDVFNGVTPWTVTHEHNSSTPPAPPGQPPAGSASAPGRPPSTPPGLSTYPPRPTSVPTPPVSPGRPTSSSKSPTHPAPPSHPTSPPTSHSHSPAPPSPSSSPHSR